MMCPMVYAPVCGSNGVTYSNACRMRVSACVSGKTITVAHEGKCEGSGNVVKPINRLTVGNGEHREDNNDGEHREVPLRGGSRSRNTLM